MPHNEPAQVTSIVTRILEGLGIRYLIGGSLASTIYGMVRMTQDSDIVADLKLEQVNSFTAALVKDFYIDEEMIFQAIVQRSSFNLLHRTSFFKIDIFIPKMRPFTEQQFARAQRQVLSLEPPVEAFVCSSEDTVLAKLEWYRMGGEVSYRQWRDVLGIIEVQGAALDLVYLRRWAMELEIADLFERALQGGA